MSVRIGVDIGGTFTDVALLDDARGRLELFKLPTTPGDPSVAALEGIEAILAAAGARAGEVTAVGHGTTVGTNAILEGRTARVGLLTTAGFRDLLDIARQRRPKTYDMTVDRARPLVLRRHRHELVERTRYDGTVATPLDLAPLPGILEALAADEVEAIAVCFLHAYANPAHERAVERALAAAGSQFAVSLSSEVAPEFREYERFSTTVINAALVPVMRAYLRNFEARVREVGIAGTTYLSQSSGGVMTLEAGGRLPAATLFSGPAAGVTGAIAVARQAGFEDLLTFDMGGTSTDVCLVRGGEAVIANQRSVEGHPVRTAAVDVHSVGAGGGSAAGLDAGGFLRVGPRSVGAVPGPVCYGRGGTIPAVTDANLILGRLGPGLLDGRVPLYLDRATGAIVEAVGAGKRVSAVEAARGVLEVVNSNMVRALRVVSVERGWDPRDFTLVAFGGAGPLHGCDLARELGVRRVLVPPAPGILCAMGLLVADLRSDASRTYLRSAGGVSGAELTAWFEDVRAQAARAMAVPKGTAVELLRWLDMRYAGQNYELRVPVPIDALSDDDVSRIVKSFHESHRRRHGYEAPEADVQIVNVRVALRVPPAPLPAVSRPRASAAPPAAAGRREVFFAEAGRFVATPVYQRASLPVGFDLAGPLVIEQMDSTVIVPPGVRGGVDDWGNVVLELA